jgi:hypothetical protein
MNAWTDCLTYEDDGMTAHPVQPDEVLTLQLLECRELRARCPEIYQALIDSRRVRQPAPNRARRSADPRALLPLRAHTRRAGDYAASARST